MRGRFLNLHRLSFFLSSPFRSTFCPLTSQIFLHRLANPRYRIIIQCHRVLLYLWYGILQYSTAQSLFLSSSASQGERTPMDITSDNYLFYNFQTLPSSRSFYDTFTIVVRWLYFTDILYPSVSNTQSPFSGTVCAGQTTSHHRHDNLERMDSTQSLGGLQHRPCTPCATSKDHLVHLVGHVCLLCNMIQ